MFLEKDLKVQLQRQRILGKTDVTQEKSHPKDCKYEDRGIRKFHGHYTKSEKDVSLLCCICGEDGHVATVGPGYSKIIQYFACKRFVEMTPDERFMELKTKRLCFQCLLPGASSYDGKHREGKCQRDFVCKHPSHQRYPRKKHVLVCNEHKNNQENKDLLPVTATMKLDLHELVQRKLDWDDPIPDELRPLWKSHFEMMQEINNLKYRQAVIPDDATSLDINTIDFGDASKSIACVYARFQRKFGGYSCQLVLARSRLIQEGMSQPRVELYAAVLNTHSGEVVKKAFYKHHQHSYKLTGSQITLDWISNEERPLKQWVRNRVVEKRRFTNPKVWNYVDTKNMIADHGTRRGSTLSDVSQESAWINGFEWMTKDSESFPTKSVRDVSLNQNEMQELHKEIPFSHGYDQTREVKKLILNCVVVARNIPDGVIKRYKFSGYLIDPNKHRFHAIIRIIAGVIKFIRILKERVKQKTDRKNIEETSCSKVAVYLSEGDLNNAEKYFFMAATREIKYFMKKKQYRKFSQEKNGILRYTGRILPTDETRAVNPMTSAMKDLTSTTFCVPVIDKYSPIAYSIVNDIHWNNKTVKHSGIDSVWRYVLKYVFIVEGRELVKKIKNSCQRCRYLAKRTIEVAMGPISRYNMTIAPAFVISQVDLAGPFKSYSIKQTCNIKGMVGSVCVCYHLNN